jgi:uncharacterized membrane protein
MKPSSFLARVTVVVALAAVMIGLAYAVPLDGTTHAGWIRLLGRFHPLVVHLPLALLLLVPVLEVLGRRRAALKEAAGFVLGLAVIGAVAAVFAGLALAWADGHEGKLLTDHLWGGIAVAIGAALGWLVRGRWAVPYATILVVTLGTLAWAAHQGGSLTHGAEYLTEPLPQWVRQALRLPDPVLPDIHPPGTVFGDAVQPILEKHCFACHGPEKQKGEYRMDQFAALLTGGKSGATAIVPGQLGQSELLRRILLDTTDDKVMPPRKKPRLSSDEIALLRWWIKQGASRDLEVAAVRDAPSTVAAWLASARKETSDAEAAPVARVGDYSSFHGQIAQLEQELGIKIVPVSRYPGDGLIVRTRGAEKRFGDAELSQLLPIAPFVVEAELAETQVTDAAIKTLQAFTHLERLHLERTRITGETLAQLQTLSQLKYLNLCGTAVSDQTAAALGTISSLQQLYLFGSRVTTQGAQALQRSLPQCRIGPVEVPKLPAL